MRMMFLRGFEDYKREVAARSQIGLSQKEGTKAGAQPHSRKIEED